MCTYFYLSTFVSMYINTYIHTRNLQGSRVSGFVQILVSFNEHHCYIILSLLLSMDMSIRIKNKQTNKNVNFEKLFYKV